MVTPLNGRADKVLLLVRTTPREDGAGRTDGLSLFYLDLDRRYCDIREIAKMGRKAVDSNEIFFDGLPATAGELVGGGPEDNAEIILRVLEGGDRGVARTAVLMNAGAALYVADISETIEDGVTAAAAAIDDGRALEALQDLREATNASTSG